MTLWAFLVVVHSMTGSGPASLHGRQLTSAEEVAVRRAAYGGELVSVSPKKDFKSILKVPKPMVELYRIKPKAVLALLTRIVDGGNPSDAIKAASYALEMAVGPGRGEKCARMCTEEAFDVVDADLGQTQRGYLVNQLQELLSNR